MEDTYKVFEKMEVTGRTLLIVHTNDVDIKTLPENVWYKEKEYKVRAFGEGTGLYKDYVALSITGV